MRRLLLPLLGLLASATSTSDPQQPLLDDVHDAAEPPPVSVDLFRSLERTSRIVDITYCVGTSGISQPFSCVSRCNEFPSFNLVKTWNTGVLLSDSCGYIAVDHGKRRPGDEDRLGGEVGEKAIVVAFRGTYSITNTVVDLSTIPQEYVPYPAPDDGDGDGEPGGEPDKRRRCEDCTVHMGFLASWRQARKLVLPELKKLRAEYPDYPVHLVGHSLGGAVAMLASLEVRMSLGWDNVIVTTFGEPKVGNQGLCDYVDTVFDLDKEGGDPMNRTYRRVTHAGDPVPLLPLTEWGYKPHAGELYITKSELSPSIEDVVVCEGDSDSRCITKGDGGLFEARMRGLVDAAAEMREDEDGEGEVDSEWWLRRRLPGFPSRLKLWQLFFAHRDYFWRLGLCVPGGDPANWGRDKYGGGHVGLTAEEL